MKTKYYPQPRKLKKKGRNRFVPRGELIHYYQLLEASFPSELFLSSGALGLGLPPSAAALPCPPFNSLAYLQLWIGFQNLVKNTKARLSLLHPGSFTKTLRQPSRLLTQHQALTYLFTIANIPSSFCSHLYRFSQLRFARHVESKTTSHPHISPNSNENVQ